MDTQQLWQATLGELELLLSKANFTTWFKNTGVSSLREGKVIISVSNNFTKEWLEKKYHQTILKALRNVTNQEIKEIKYSVEPLPNQSPVKSELEPNLENRPTETEPTKKTAISNNQLAGEERKKNQKQLDNFNINTRYTFGNFIVGKNNELAHAAALAVSKSPGRTYNPLFIYGGVGLGKTHLLQAIGHKILIENNQEKKTLYVSCEKFTNDFISAIQNGQTKNFYQKYRLVDILLIDDIQFISRKEQTQEAFFHTFNDLHQHNKQVVISSDRPPKAIADLEHRLVSRFEWGMIADISTPDLETKIAIIESKAKEKNYSLTPEISNYLATVIRNNIRELEGALNKIIGYSQLKNRQLKLEEIKEIISSITINSQKKPLTIKLILNTVSEYFDIKIEDIISPCRKKNLAEARQTIMYLIREELKTSYPVIGQEIGGRDHTTVIHACDKISEKIKNNNKVRQDIEILKQKLHS